MKNIVLLFLILCAVLGLTTANALVVVLQRPTGQLISGATPGGAVVAVEVDADGKINVNSTGSGTQDVDVVANSIGLATEVTLDAVKTAVESTDPVAVNPFGGVLIQGAILTPMTQTTSTEVIAGTALNYQYITDCTCSNSSTTVSTDIVLQDGSGGTSIAVIPCPAATVATTGGGGGTFNFPSPRKVPTVGNGLFAANVTTGSSTKLMCGGWRSTVSY